MITKTFLGGGESPAGATSRRPGAAPTETYPVGCRVPAAAGSYGHAKPSTARVVSPTAVATAAGSGSLGMTSRLPRASTPDPAAIYSWHLPRRRYLPLLTDSVPVDVHGPARTDARRMPRSASLVDTVVGAVATRRPGPCLPGAAPAPRRRRVRASGGWLRRFRRALRRTRPISP